MSGMVYKQARTAGGLKWKKRIARLDLKSGIFTLTPLMEVGEHHDAPAEASSKKKVTEIIDSFTVVSMRNEKDKDNADHPWRIELRFCHLGSNSTQTVLLLAVRDTSVRDEWLAALRNVIHDKAQIREQYSKYFDQESEKEIENYVENKSRILSTPLSVVHELFQIYDQDNSGALELGEVEYLFQDLLYTYGRQLPIEDIKARASECVQMSSSLQPGKVTRSEFEDYVANNPCIFGNMLMWRCMFSKYALEITDEIEEPGLIQLVLDVMSSAGRCMDKEAGRRFAKQILKNYGGDDATLSFPAFLQYASTREDLFGSFAPQSTTFRPESKRIMNPAGSPGGELGKDNNMTQLSDQEMKMGMDSGSTRPYPSSISVRKSQRYPIMHETFKRSSPMLKKESSNALLAEEPSVPSVFIGPTDHPKRQGYSIKWRKHAESTDDKGQGGKETESGQEREENQLLKSLGRSMSLGNIYSVLSASDDTSSMPSSDGVNTRPDRPGRNDKAQLRRPLASSSSKKTSEVKSSPLLRRHINHELGDLYRSYQLPGRLFQSKSSTSERRAVTASTSSSILLEDAEYGSQASQTSFL
ncbi:hypothetical protein GUITHDRAFT_105109 [Guillardia theta CCMP2712]|uniref:PH domain-containing protein n=1 Tax=Guillardia theta (strain CCMP2712) TaxID=905079 RepID=L1JKH3_GUITC|nr:hypothetical protein GUITHDRAFT_105109 [Guillardia theta CCMP2712]EKX49028.1 hypothetical protein GUITHDRAFT_105109 [Guillardia theta CCMP2712]|eukprot:XP_005836008.1 hypothetical protein GUITHDRAFT_105109 [Guillardia theta CCMP2712]